MNSSLPPSNDQHQAGRYEIRLKGRLDAHWASWFEGLSLSHESDGTTLIQGTIADQAALHGVLRKVRDLGLTLLSVIQVDPQKGNAPDNNADTDRSRLNKEIDQ